MSDLAVPNVAIGRLMAGVRGSSLTIWLCATVVVVFLIWSSLASVDEIVRAEGEVISSSRPQIIQNLEGGILAELYVTEGDIVEQGDTFARLRGTSFQSSSVPSGEHTILATATATNAVAKTDRPQSQYSSL